MTEKQAMAGRKKYLELMAKRKGLLKGTLKPRSVKNLYEGSFDTEFEIAFCEEEYIAWLAFSKIAAETKKSNRIYVLIDSTNVYDDNGKIIDRIFLFMDLENLSTRTVKTLDLGDFYREKDKNGKQLNIILDPNYCSGIEAFEKERLNFFQLLSGYSQAYAVERYKNGTYLTEYKKR